jgi:hypothetical protein
MWVLLEISENVIVPVDIEALHRRLCPISPLLVALEELNTESGAGRYVLLDALHGMPSCLVQGTQCEAVKTFLEHLGRPDSVDIVLRSLEQKLHASAEFAVYIYAAADTRYRQKSSELQFPLGC